MADHKTFPKVPTNPVDWNDPTLVSLLNKTGEWHLDNRLAYPPKDIQIQFGWGGGTVKPAVLVWQGEEAMVIATSFPIEHGEHVRVNKYLEDDFGTQWGEVVESRAGHRADDRTHGTHVHWLHMR